VIPVLDVGEKLGIANKEDATLKLLLMNTNAGKVACLVDEVSEITWAVGDEVSPFPTMLRSPNTTYAECIVRKNERLIIILDTAHLFDDQEVKQIEKMKG
jgi:chemotaxis signal transduction protein